MVITRGYNFCHTCSAHSSSWSVRKDTKVVYTIRSMSHDWVLYCNVPPNNPRMLCGLDEEMDDKGLFILPLVNRRQFSLDLVFRIELRDGVI